MGSDELVDARWSSHPGVCHSVVETGAALRPCGRVPDPRSKPISGAALAGAVVALRAVGSVDVGVDGLDRVGRRIAHRGVDG
jgi:hypothetical protein